MGNGEVGKILYRARGPFQIIEDLGSDLYHVKRYNDANFAVMRYI